MKKLSVIIVSFAVICLSFFTASAVSMDEEIDSVYEEFGVEEVEQATPDSILSIYREFEVSPSQPLAEKEVNVLELLFAQFKELAADYVEPINTLGFLVVIMIFAFVMSNLLGEKAWAQELFELITLASCAMLIFTPVRDVFYQVSESVSACTVYLSSFIPVFAALLTASGFKAVASVYSVVMVAYSEGFSAVNSNLFVPCCEMLLSTTVCTSLAKVPFSLASGVKKLIVSLVSVLTAVLTGIISLQTRLSGITDNLALKAAKSALGTFVPVVGGAWGDSLSVILGSVDLVRSSVGIYSVITVALIFLPAIVKLLMWQGAIWMSKSLFEVAEKKAMVEMLNSISGLLTILLVILLCSLLLIVMSILTVLSLGNSL